VQKLPRPLPLFPLPNGVLFPKMTLALHVFEPRYRKLVADVLQTHKTIGMTLLRPGWESDYHGRPAIYPVGCAGALERCEPLADGRFNLSLRGLGRFRVTEEHAGEPYRLASVDALEDPPGGSLEELEAARRTLTAAIGRAKDGPAVLVMQPELSPELFVNALSQSMDLTPVERQSLLVCDTLLARCRVLAEILEFKALESACGGVAGDSVH
jgi:uncharacterized protein